MGDIMIGPPHRHRVGHNWLSNFLTLWSKHCRNSFTQQLSKMSAIYSIFKHYDVCSMAVLINDNKPAMLIQAEHAWYPTIMQASCTIDLMFAGMITVCSDSAMKTGHMKVKN